MTARKWAHPRIQVSGMLLVLGLDLFFILWQESSGAYTRELIWQYAGFPQSMDPSGWIWFAGKLASFVLFPLAFINLRQLKGKT